MTQKVDPSPASDGQAFMVAQAIYHHGAVGDGWIVPGGDTKAASHPTSGLGAITQQFGYNGADGLTVQFQAGEAYVGGAWLATDEFLEVTLADDTAGQMVELGWDYDATDTVKVALADDFDDLEASIPLYEFDTASGSVTSDTDHRIVGKQAALESGGIGEGEVLFSAVADAVGTLGDSANEIWRAGSDTSDLLMMVRAPSTDRMNLVWNAYHDGSDWRYIVGNEEAYRMTYGGVAGDHGVSFYSAPSGTADGTVSDWYGFAVQDTGDLLSLHTTSDGSSNWQRLYDRSASELAQQFLGGPAADLTSYPLPAGDIDDGSGSGLDADTVDGYEATELQGDTALFDQITTHTDADNTAPLDVDTGSITDASTKYSYFTVRFSYCNHSTSGTPSKNHLRVSVNNIGTSNYDTLRVAHDGGVDRDPDRTAWNWIGRTWDTGETAHGELTIRGKEPHSASGTRSYVTMSNDSVGNTQAWQALGGTLTQDVPNVTSIQVSSVGDATGKVAILGNMY